MIENDVRINHQNRLNDNLNKQKSKIEQVTPFDVVDPTRVTKTTKDNQSNQTSQNNLNFNFDSVYEKFVQALKNSPVLSENGKKILLNKQFINHNIKSDPVLNTLFENFIKNITMNQTEIFNFLKFQQTTYTNYSGNFFNELRNLLNKNSNNDDFKLVLRNFLKSYDCFVSVDKTYNSINSALNNIKLNLPQILKEPFNELINKMISDNLTNSLDLNLSLLKNEILPFVGRYISKMNDFGPVRDYVSVLMHNIVRLESGSKESFSNDLDNLMEHLKYNLNVSEEKLQSIKLSLINSYEFTTTTKNDSIDSFLKLIETGIKDSTNVLNKGTMEDIEHSLLFNQNVQIPLTHMFLPLNFNGMFMFSELWISKHYESSDDKNDKKNKLKLTESYKIFITFEIQNLGYFETILNYKNSNISLDIYVPNSFSNSIDKIKKEITTILNKNNLLTTNINIYESINKRKFNEVFSNLSERKSGVDVVI
ncbi:MAG: hypothetical protein K0Q97_2296 [Bacillota bacterium]|nr:hypothetical protein [Bacillota bacterium]